MAHHRRPTKGKPSRTRGHHQAQNTVRATFSWALLGPQPQHGDYPRKQGQGDAVVDAVWPPGAAQKPPQPGVGIQQVQPQALFLTLRRPDNFFGDNVIWPHLGYGPLYQVIQLPQVVGKVVGLEAANCFGG